MSFAKKRPALASFGRASIALTDFLREAETLDMEDQMFIENHLVIVQLAYSTWRRGHHEQEPNQPATQFGLNDSDQTAA